MPYRQTLTLVIVSDAKDLLSIGRRRAYHSQNIASP